MGKQIELFQAKKDVDEFLEYLFDSGYSIADGVGEKLNIEQAKNSKSYSLFILFDNSYIEKSNSGYLDAIISEAIQYSRGFMKANILSNGRLWMEKKCFDSNDLQINKSKEFTDMYTVIIRWLKKHYIRSDCHMYYIGKSAYSQLKTNNIICMAGPKNIVPFS